MVSSVMRAADITVAGGNKCRQSVGGEDGRYGGKMQDRTKKESQMISEPRVEVRAEQPYVAIPIKATLKEWSRANALVGEVFEWLGQKGVELAGPPFFRYWMIGDMDNKFHIEVGAPVRNAVSGDGRVLAGSIPGGPYATLVHTGHPDRLVHSLTALEDWARRQGLKWDNRREGKDEIWGGRFEFYLTDPAEQPDLEKWSIEIAYLLRDDSAQK